MGLTFLKPYLVEGQVQIRGEQYLPQYREGLRELRRTLTLPGFRPGHVPVEYVRGRYGKEVLENLLTQQFLTQVEKELGEGRLMALPAFRREPEEVRPEPPYGDYVYNFRALVGPEEPLQVRSSAPPLYTYEAQVGDMGLFQRYVRLLLGEGEPLPQLPPEVPRGKEIYARLQLLLPGREGRVQLAWVSWLSPFPYSLMAGHEIGAEVELVPSYLMPYVEAIRAGVPDFSPLETGSVKVRIRSAMLSTPASDEKLVQTLKLSDISEETWKALLEREAQRLLRQLNERTYKAGFLHAASVEIPDDIAQVNYLAYLRRSSRQEERRLLTYEEYRSVLGWRIFLESHLEHVPELEISDEEVEENLWEKMQAYVGSTEEGRALLEQIVSTEGSRQALVRGIMGEEREDFRVSLRYERFEKWLDTTYGPRPKKPVPLSAILLAGL